MKLCRGDLTSTRADMSEIAPPIRQKKQSQHDRPARRACAGMEMTMNRVERQRAAEGATISIEDQALVIEWVLAHFSFHATTMDKLRAAAATLRKIQAGDAAKGSPHD